MAQKAGPLAIRDVVDDTLERCVVDKPAARTVEHAGPDFWSEVQGVVTKQIAEHWS